ncbi:carboxylesterase/lipase family protein [Streptomyces sp. NPDC087420]|uniref:carboxylesterase/lipase family protein n=1 Tax=Streptomyces sp. NPDC087420 TaxID=3365785 RepID=UPI0038389DE6
MSDTPRGPQVATSQGAVRGTVEADVHVFRGVPFAQPPVGALRLAAPRPVAPWDGVRDAVTFGPCPPQSGMSMSADTTLPRGSGGTAPAGTDDRGWLTLNVWTPDLGAAGLPVLFWIYGGGYTEGRADDPMYDGARLASENGVVVVSVNYRLGAEGFGLFAGAPANRGLLDQTAALTWVRDNIGAFGGDPARVTVFGESAGGGSVAALLAMPRTQGLFRRAVVQSMPGKFYSRELAEGLGRAMADQAGVPATAAGVASVEPRALADATTALARRMAGDPRRWGVEANRPVSPVIDGDVLPRSPWDALAAGQARDVTVLGGHTRNEWLAIMAFAGQLDGMDEAVVDTYLHALTPDGGKAYREAFPEARPWQLYEKLMTDWSFRAPLLRLLDAQVAGGGTAYAYELAWKTTLFGRPVHGAPHGSDLPLVFGNFGAGPFGGEPTEAERALSARMRTAWTSFAGGGDPGWPAYDSESRVAKVFDLEDSVGPYTGQVNLALWAHTTFGAVPAPPQG